MTQGATEDGSRCAHRGLSAPARHRHVSNALAEDLERRGDTSARLSRAQQARHARERAIHSSLSSSACRTVRGPDPATTCSSASTSSKSHGRRTADGRVRVQPCDARVKVKDGTEPVEATAELVSGAQLDESTRKIRGKYGFFTKITKLLATIGRIVKRNRIPYGDRGVVITLAV